jgi:hypothetical protein
MANRKVVQFLSEVFSELESKTGWTDWESKPVSNAVDERASVFKRVLYASPGHTQLRLVVMPKADNQHPPDAWRCCVEIGRKNAVRHEITLLEKRGTVSEVAAEGLAKLQAFVGAPSSSPKRGLRPTTATALAREQAVLKVLYEGDTFSVEQIIEQAHLTFYGSEDSYEGEDPYKVVQSILKALARRGRVVDKGEAGWGLLMPEPTKLREEELTDVYVAMWNDRHTEPSATLFSSEEKAITWAKEKVREHLRPGESANEEEIAGWLYHGEYGVEGDCLWVVKTALDAEVTPGDNEGKWRLSAKEEAELYVGRWKDWAYKLVPGAFSADDARREISKRFFAIEEAEAHEDAWEKLYKGWTDWAVTLIGIDVASGFVVPGPVRLRELIENAERSRREERDEAREELTLWEEWARGLSLQEPSDRARADIAGRLRRAEAAAKAHVDFAVSGKDPLLDLREGDDLGLAKNPYAEQLQRLVEELEQESRYDHWGRDAQRALQKALKWACAAQDRANSEEEHMCSFCGKKPSLAGVSSCEDCTPL